LVLSPLAVIIANYLGFSLYDRAGLELQLNKYYGNLTFNDILTNELLVNSYDFNSKQPRFFSKYFMQHDQGNYEVPLRTAVGGSSSAPAFFDP
jgi:patatin-like phospholipase/acyl hydrolase